MLIFTVLISIFDRQLNPVGSDGPFQLLKDISLPTLVDPESRSAGEAEESRRREGPGTNTPATKLSLSPTVSDGHIHRFGFMSVYECNADGCIG